MTRHFTALLMMSFAVFVAGNHFSDTMQLARYHHEGLKRSLRDLTEHKRTLASSDVEAKILQQLEEMAAFIRSVHTFCETIQESSTGNTSADNEKSKLEKPEEELVPVDLTVANDKPNMSTVEFTIKHSVPGNVEMFYMNGFSGKYPKRRIKMNSENQKMKLSKVSFDIETKHFCSNKEIEEDNDISFSFSSKNRKGFATHVFIDLCDNDAEENALKGKCVHELLPPSVDFRLIPESNKLVPKPGENATLIVELHFSSIPGVDPRPSSEPWFSLYTFSYNRETGNFSSVITSIGKDVKDNQTVKVSDYPIGFLEGQQPFISVKEIFVSEEKTPDLFASKQALQNQNITAAFLKLTFNTASGDESGRVFLEQSDNCPFYRVRRTRQIRTLNVRQQGQRHPIPRGLIEFISELEEQVCVISDRVSYWNHCTVVCTVLGTGYLDVVLTKTDGANMTLPKASVVEDFYWTKAWIDFGPPRPEHAGTYECRVRNQDGNEAVSVISVYVGRSPTIVDKTVLTLEDGTRVFNCTASGSDLQFSFYEVEYANDDEVSTRIDLDPSLQVSIKSNEDGSQSALLSVPDQTALTGDDVKCVVNNPISSHGSKFYL